MNKELFQNKLYIVHNIFFLFVDLVYDKANLRAFEYDSRNKVKPTSEINLK